jgi:hypothetical protein
MAITHSASLYGFGAFRPAAFEAPSAGKAIAKAVAAIDATIAPAMAASAAAWGESMTIDARRGYTGGSSSHGAFGLSWAARPHDSWLDLSLASMPAHPAIDYAGAISERPPAE